MKKRREDEHDDLESFKRRDDRPRGCACQSSSDKELYEVLQNGRVQVKWSVSRRASLPLTAEQKESRRRTWLRRKKDFSSLTTLRSSACSSSLSWVNGIEPEVEMATSAAWRTSSGRLSSEGALGDLDLAMRELRQRERGATEAKHTSRRLGEGDPSWRKL